jgi:predicted permease
MSMRYALGAKRGRIVAQLLVEGGMLGIAGAAAGLALAPVVVKALVRMMTGADPGNEPYSTTIDSRILLFTLAVALVSSLLFSIAPLLHFLRPDLAGALRQNAGTPSKGSLRFRKIAVGVQIAISVMLLAGGGLFVRTLDNLRHQAVGFETTRLLTFSLDPSSSGYGEDRAAQIVTNSIEALRAIPGVVSVGATNDPELAGNSEHSSFTLQGYTPAEDEILHFEDVRLTPDYFATLRQPILAGREFTAADAKGQTPVAVVNLSLAKHYYGSAQKALGRVLAQGRGPDVKPDTTIVGVVGDTKHENLRTDMGPAVYRPYLQDKHPLGLQMYVRTTGEPATVKGAIRQTIQHLDPTLVVDGLYTMEEQVDSSASDNRALAFLAVGFSILATVLAAVGFYGVLAYSTEQRTREIGVRLALGSPRSQVVLLISREMLVIASIATIVALPSTVALARLFSSQLYGVSAFDPITLTAAVLMTALMIAVAAALPARRAAAVEPMQALRTE